eukprot:gene15006-biopygen11769
MGPRANALGSPCQGDGLEGQGPWIPLPRGWARGPGPLDPLTGWARGPGPLDPLAKGMGPRARALGSPCRGDGHEGQGPRIPLPRGWARGPTPLRNPLRALASRIGPCCNAGPPRRTFPPPRHWRSEWHGWRGPVSLGRGMGKRRRAPRARAEPAGDSALAEEAQLAG